MNNYYLNCHPHPRLTICSIVYNIQRQREETIYNVAMAFRGREKKHFSNFPANLSNNPNLDGSENIFLTASFRDIKGTVSRKKKNKISLK